MTIHRCALCSGALVNPARHNDAFYCHRDDDEVSCYQLATMRDAISKSEFARKYLEDLL